MRVPNTGVGGAFVDRPDQRLEQLRRVLAVAVQEGDHIEAVVDAY